MYTRTSDYFDDMFVYAEQLIKQGDAFCDNTVLEDMRKMREERLPSPNRDLCKQTFLFYVNIIIHIISVIASI